MEIFIPNINTSKNVISGEVELFRQKIFDIQNPKNQKYEILTRVNWKWFDLFLKGKSDIQKVQYDLFLLKEVLKRMWTSKESNSQDITFNMSPVTLTDPKNIQSILRILSQYPITSKLYIEITENWYFDENDIILLNRNISKLSQHWIICWIDDYPNLNNNNELLWRIKNIGFIKIDKWVLLEYSKWKITKDNLLEKLTQYLLDISTHYPNIPLVIEGIENKHIMDIISLYFWNKFRFMQWYFIQYPEPF